MKKSNTKGLLAGAAAAAALGAVAGMMLATKSGKKMRGDMKKTAAQFYREASPQLRKLKSVGKANFEKFMGKAVTKYAAAKKLSMAEKRQLMKEAKSAWGKLKKHLK